MEYPKVLVATPTWFRKDYCLDEFADAIKNLSYPNYDILIADTSPDDYIKKIEEKNLPVVKSPYIDELRLNTRNARNILRSEFLIKGYDYFLSVESDNIPPKDIIERLMSYKKDVCAAWYMLRTGIPSISTKSPYESRTVVIPNMNEMPEIFKVFMAGLGCVLIHKSVLEKISFKVFRKFDNTDREIKWWDDVWFYIDCMKFGIEVWCVRDLKIPHKIIFEPINQGNAGFF